MTAHTPDDIERGEWVRAGVAALEPYRRFTPTGLADGVDSEHLQTAAVFAVNAVIDAVADGIAARALNDAAEKAEAMGQRDFADWLRGLARAAEQETHNE